MKVLIIGVYRDGTGYGNIAIDYALALDSVGIDVVCRHIKLNNTNHPIPKRIEELEAKSSDGCQAVIQITVPPQFEYNAGAGVNIGLYCTEFDQMNYSDWPSYINLMDEAWVLNNQSRRASVASGVNIPVSVVNPPTDLGKFSTSFPPLSELRSNSFKFYTIGEFVRRKNFAALIKAFHLEFSPDENVELVIKTGLPGMKNSQEAMIRFCNEIKNGLRLYPRVEDYRREIVITRRLSDSELCSLHVACDCFVSPSYGEAWAIPAFDALGFGKTPIVGQHTGFLDYIDHHNGWLVPSRLEPVFGMNGVSPPNYATSRDNWRSIDVIALQDAMREAFSNAYLRNKKSSLGLDRVEEFGYQRIGNKMRCLLEEAIKRKGDSP